MKKKRSNKGYTKSTEYVEVRVKRAASYEEVASTSKSVLGLPHQDTGMLSLFRCDGTLIPDKKILDNTWTIGGYLRKSCSQIKLGVGYLMQVFHLL